jgi:hypothetical protein
LSCRLNIAVQPEQVVGIELLLDFRQSRIRGTVIACRIAVVEVDVVILDTHERLERRVQEARGSDPLLVQCRILPAGVYDQHQLRVPVPKSRVQLTDPFHGAAGDVAADNQAWVLGVNDRVYQSLRSILDHAIPRIGAYAMVEYAIADDLHDHMILDDDAVNGGFADHAKRCQLLLAGGRITVINHFHDRGRIPVRDA